MFDIGWSELLIIGIVALIAIGPKELPRVLRTVGNYMGKIRRMASDFQGQFQEAMREAEMEDLKKQVDQMTSAADDLTHFDPMDEMNKQFDSMVKDEGKPASGASTDPGAVTPEAVSADLPGPVAPDTEIPRSGGDVAVAPEAPQPETPAPKTASGGSGA